MNFLVKACAMYVMLIDFGVLVRMTFINGLVTHILTRHPFRFCYYVRLKNARFI